MRKIHVPEWWIMTWQAPWLLNLISRITRTRYDGITLPFLIITRHCDADFRRASAPRQRSWAQLINHERIHAHQQIETLIVGFFVLYVFEYLWARVEGWSHYDAYRRISFETEAYHHQHQLDYLATRKRFAFARHWSD